jgi:hypothetical protein
MFFGRLAICVLSVFLLSFSAPAFAGKDKTESAWKYAYQDISGSVTDASALTQLSALNKQMNDGYGDLDRGEFYELASEVYDKAIEITTKHGGKKVYKPDWLD